jgi:hypothetical protein
MISFMHKTLQLFAHKYIGDHVNLGQICTLFRAFAILLGGLHVYAAITSQSMNADGISYLDIGDAYFRADWQNAINPVWSPLYSLMLGFANFVIRPSMQWEFATVHLINFFIYVGALGSFEFMWRKARLFAISNTEGEILQMPDWLWWTLGYLLFIWTSLSLIQIWSVTPDMLMAVFVFLAAGLIAQLRLGDENRRQLLSLGLVLGLGYLSKTFMFSIALVFLSLAWLVKKRSWNSWSRTLLPLLVFLSISLPFIMLISEKKGKLTIGEAGTVTYLRYVEGIPSPHWQGDPLGRVVPTHPSRVIHQSPRVYEFSGPVGGTYPISTDPSYWYDGIAPRFDFARLLARLSASGLVYAELFLQQQGILMACILALYLMYQRRTHGVHESLQRWTLLIPAIFAFALYGMVLVEGRYIGAFILLFWADILANVRLPDLANNRSWLRVLGVIACVGLLANILIFNLDGFKRLNPSEGAGFTSLAASPARPLRVAQALHDLNISPGDKVGVIGYAYDSFWARLARVKIVAEMLDVDSDDFWRGDDALQQSVLQAFAGTGARAVVAEHVPEYAQLDDWYQVGESNYYIFRFKR